MDSNPTHRRAFLRNAGAGGLLLASTTLGAQQPAPESIEHAGAGRPLTEKEKLARIASNTWPIRYIFKTRAIMASDEQIRQMKSKYGEITMLDFPAFTKEHF